MAGVECLIPGRSRLGECPIWSGREQRLYWIDSRGPTVFSLDPALGRVRSRAMPAVIGSIALCRGGGLLVAMQTGIYRLDFDDGRLDFIVDPENDLPENRFNDGRVDRRGRFWAGTMNDIRRDPTGSLYRLDPNLAVTKIRGDIIVPNSICWSPDDRVFYFADTYRHRIMAYDFDVDDGVVSNMRLFVDATGFKGRPDGSAVDAEGFVWNAEYGGGRLVRYAPDGSIDRTVELPVTQPSSCCFGGPKLDVLYITSATQRLSEIDLAAQPLAGSLFAADVGVAGLPEHEFAT